MRTEKEIEADAVDGAPFSNMTGFEVWAASNCERGSGCRFDKTWGTSDTDAECHLLTVSMVMAKTPQEWLEDDALTECSAYEEFVAVGTDDDPSDVEMETVIVPVPGQLDLFDPTDPGSTFPGQGGM